MKYPRDKKGKLEHLKVVKKRGDNYKPGFHQVHHKGGNPKNYKSSNLETMYVTEHKVHHHVKRLEKKLKKYWLKKKLYWYFIARLRQESLNSSF